jgi:hypothetical protein
MIRNAFLALTALILTTGGFGGTVAAMQFAANTVQVA